MNYHKRSEIEFWLRDARPDERIFVALEAQLGFAVDSVDRPNPAALGVIMPLDYAHGFAVEMTVCWRHDQVVEHDPEDIARALSVALETDVLMDLDYERFGNRWLLARPDGSWEEVQVMELFETPGGHVRVEVDSGDEGEDAQFAGLEIKHESDYGPRVPREELSSDGGDLLLWQGQPFTGVVLGHTPRNAGRTEACCVKGRMEGPCKWWYPNGQLWLAEIVLPGRPADRTLIWTDTGRLRARIERAYGLIMLMLSDNGQGGLREEFRMTPDVEVFRYIETWLATGDNWYAERHVLPSGVRVPEAMLELNDDDHTTLQGRPFTGVGYEVYGGGQLLEENTYINGITAQPCRRWYESGQLKYEAVTVEGESVEQSTSWYEDGTTMSITERESGIEIRHREWNRNGALVMERTLPTESTAYQHLLEQREKNHRRG